MTAHEPATRPSDLFRLLSLMADGATIRTNRPAGLTIGGITPQPVPRRVIKQLARHGWIEHLAFAWVITDGGRAVIGRWPV